jgi:hypothetical protein
MDNLEQPPQIPPELFGQLEALVTKHEPLEAVNQLCQSLESLGDWDSYFYALLLKKRVEMGISPFPTGSQEDFPQSLHDEYEQTIRQAGQKVAQEFIKAGNLHRAYTYLNMLGELKTLTEHFENAPPPDEANIQSYIEVALYRNIHPFKGFSVLLDRYGICNAVTAFSSHDFASHNSAKQECIKLLVRSLHQQLKERLTNDLESRGFSWPEGATIAQTIQKHPELMDEGAYHVDTSHLSNICSFALELDPCPEQLLAIDLCAYGEKLGPGFQTENDPPFENMYRDYGILIRTLAGIDVENGVTHFRNKIEPAMAEGNTLPAEVYVNLLTKLNRTQEACEVAKKYLAKENRQMACPSVYELCRNNRDFAGLAEVALARGDGVNYLAALIAARSSS